MADTIQVRLAAAACDRCPVAVLSERTALREVRVDPVDERADFVADERPPDPPGELVATFVLTGDGELQAIVNVFGAAEVRRILVDRDEGDGGDGDWRRDVVPIDLSGVTERQAAEPGDVGRASDAAVIPSSRGC
ncbi:hypothetical protein [Halorubrum halophilum]|uniref:hypothetical protein n=1 Tax=Halorubrum halophilum TaxID=413816 RepID=UPI0006798029|nr:hypothetical protein [Halorubrum halophilum]